MEKPSESLLTGSMYGLPSGDDLVRSLELVSLDLAGPLVEFLRSLEVFSASAKRYSKYGLGRAGNGLLRDARLKASLALPKSVTVLRSGQSQRL